MKKEYDRVRDVLTGLQIFNENGGTDVSAEHDELHSGQKYGVSLSDEQLSILKDAGWFRSREYCQCNVRILDGEEVGEHSPDCNDWTIYT